MRKLQACSALWPTVSILGSRAPLASRSGRGVFLKKSEKERALDFVWESVPCFGDVLKNRPKESWGTEQAEAQAAWIDPVAVCCFYALDPQAATWQV